MEYHGLHHMMWVITPESASNPGSAGSEGSRFGVLIWRPPRSGVQIRGVPWGDGSGSGTRPPSWGGVVSWVAGIWRGPATCWLISGYLRLRVPLYILSRARVVGKRANWRLFRCVTFTVSSCVAHYYTMQYSGITLYYGIVLLIRPLCRTRGEA